MKILDVAQGTAEWAQARAGIPTASCFDKILTAKKLELSKSSVVYRNQLLAERLVGYPIDFAPQTGWMERGIELEPEARAFYEMHFDVEVETVGFVLRDDEQVGGSPDGFVGSDGGVDFKCPAIHTHVGYLLDPNKLSDEYMMQAQGLMYLTGRQWWDLLSYHPELPHVRVRIMRDEAYIGAVDKALALFVADLNTAWKQLEPHRIAALSPTMEAA